MTRFSSAMRTDPSQIEADIGEELAWHLEHLAADLQRRGLSEGAAHAEARRRFGDPTRVTRQCRSIILKEQTMVRRLHLALTITLAALLLLSIGMGLSAAARAKAMAVRERMMAEQARLQAQKAIDAERAVRQNLEQQAGQAKPK